MHHRYIGYIKIRVPQPPALKGNVKFKTLLGQIFSLKKKINQILLATLDKIKLFLFKKTVYSSFRQGSAMEKCKQKPFR